MRKLIIENGPDRGRSAVIPGDGAFYCGRDAAAQLPIRDEMSSRRQFQIETQNGATYLRDLGSSNGTFLNGHQVRGAEPLTSNDRIQVGETIITYLDESKPSIIGQDLAGYRILDRIGRGGMGTVYRALQTSLDRVVALKLLAPHLTRNANFVNLFIREARAAGALSHPNIVQVYDVGVHGDTYFFSMEYIPGGSVEDSINRGGAQPLEWTLRVIRDAAMGLEFAEQKGIIHRDIKPGNLMIGADGVIKIGDLGIARSTAGDGTSSQKDGVSGSPHYIAPEQARGLDIDHRVDIYSLGVSFYQMLCGKTPYSGTTPREVIIKHIREEPPPLSERMPGLPPAVEELVGRMMSKERDLRPLSATALLEELKPLLIEHGGVEAAEAPPPRRSSPLVQIALFAAATIALAALTFGGVVTFSRWKKRQENERVRVEALGIELARIESAIGGAALAAASDGIAALRRQGDLPPEEDARLAALEARLEGAQAAEATRVREKELSRKLDEILNARPEDDDDPEYLYRLQSSDRDLADFAAANLGTEAAARAAEERRTLGKRIGDRKERETRAEEQFASVRSTASRFLAEGEFDLAHERVQAFPEEYRFARHRRAWEQLEAQIAEGVSAAVEKVLGAVQADLARGDKLGARTRAEAQLRKVESFPELIAPLRSELDRLAAAGPDPTPPAAAHDAQAAQNLAAAWKLWLEDASLRRTQTDVRSALFQSRANLSVEWEERLVRHKDFLYAFSPALRSMAERGTPKSPRMVRIALEGAPELAVEVRRLDYDSARVYFRRSADAVEEYRAFASLAPRDAARILCVWAETPEERLYAGFFARLAGEKEAAAEAWAGLDQEPSCRDRRTELERLLEVGLPEKD